MTVIVIVVFTNIVRKSGLSHLVTKSVGKENGCFYASTHITYSRIPYLDYNRRSSLTHSASCLTGISEKEGANKAICVCVSSVQPCRT